MVTTSVRDERAESPWYAAWQAACPASGGSHRARVVGYARGDHGRRIDCDRPLSVVCRECDARDVMRCNNHRASKCEPCSARYRVRVRRVAADGMRAVREVPGHQYLLTVTAPAVEEHLQWVPGWDRRSERPVCGCHGSAAGGIGLWNAGASACWNRLRTSLRRLAPGLEYFRATETQKRGGLHFHIPLWSPVPLSVVEVQALALRAGFGCVVDLDPIGDVERAAGYVSKYVTKATDARDEVPWDTIDKATGEVVSVADARYRTWSSSRGWGMTMKVVRAAIREAARRRAEFLASLPVAVGEGLGEPAAAGVGCIRSP